MNLPRLESWRRQMTKLDNSHCQCNHDKGKIQNQDARIPSDFKLGINNADKAFLAQLGDMGTHTRITSRRVTNTTKWISTGKKVTLVKTSLVSTTWSGSGPRVEDLITNGDGHAVFGIDVINQIPGNSDLFGWVNDLNSLIKDQNIGFEKEQVGTDNSSATDQRGQGNIATIKSALNDEATKKGNQNPSAHKGATGTEFLDITHALSFSQMEAIK